MTLTEEGAFVLSYAKAIFDLGQELQDALEDKPSKERLRIQIGVSSLLPKSVVDSVIQFILKSTPGVYLQISESEFEVMMTNLRVHKLDMILTNTPYQAPAEWGIQNYLIAKIPIYFCASKKLTRKYRRAPQDLHQAPMILPTSENQVYHAAQEYFLANKIKPKIIAEIQDVELTRKLVLAGEGLAPLNAYTIRNALPQEQLHILTSKPALDLHDNLYLIRRERKNPHVIVKGILEHFRLPIKV